MPEILFRDDFALQNWDASAGTPTRGNARTHAAEPWSLLLDPSASTEYVYYDILGKTVPRMVAGFWMQVDAYPGAGTMVAKIDAGSTECRLRISTSGELYIAGDGTPTMSSVFHGINLLADYWYWIELMIDKSTNPWTFRLKCLDKVISTTGAAAANTCQNDFLMLGTNASGTITAYYSYAMYGVATHANDWIGEQYAPYGNPYSRQVLADRPVLYLRHGIGGLTRDSSGNGRTMTQFGTNFVERAGLVASEPNGAYEYDNATATGSLELNNSALHFTGVSPFSFSVVAKPTTLDTTYRRIFSWSDESNASTNGYQLVWQNGAIVFVRRQNGTDFSCDWSTSFSAGEVRHIGGRYDGSNLRLYVDRVLRRTLADTRSIASYGGNFRVGTGQFGSSSFKGIIDELAIFNYDIGESRIQAHADSMTPPGDYPIYGQVY